MNEKDFINAAATLAAAIIATKKSESPALAARFFMDTLIALHQEYESRKAEIPSR